MLAMKLHAVLASVLLIGLLACADIAFGAVTVEAYSGRPFGVGKVTVTLPQGKPIDPAGDDRFNIIEKDGRALYPVLQHRKGRRFLQNLLEIETPVNATIYFLFQGDAPLDLTVFAPDGQRVTARPIARERRHQRLLKQWWSEYTKHFERVDESGEYPALVENYLISMLSRRTGSPLPRAGRGNWFGSKDANQALGLLLGTESIRAAIQKDLLLETSPSGPEVANQALPMPVSPIAVAYPPTAKETPIESIAMHVPHECFYIRFGNFTNYLWLRDFMDQWGGDIGNMITTRGIDYRLNEKMEQQLGLKQTVLSKILGPTVIADIAIIGNDMFTREGASIGVLFQARNNLLLGNNLKSQRTEAMKKIKGAVEKTTTFDGRTVSYIGSPSGKMRSYYVQDGDFHLVSTSEALIVRFLEAGRGIRSLGASVEFRHARTVMPLERNDTIFAYISDAFIRQIISPHYRVEMTRRMRSLSEIETIRVSRLAARAEGSTAPTVAELIADGFLPKGFGYRVDGSELIETEHGFIDSLRGAPGTFTPVPDVPVINVTKSEAAAYQRFGQIYRNEWKRVDPIMAAIRRTPLGKPGLERMTIELKVTPYHKQTYSSVENFLGPATTIGIAPIEGDLISLQFIGSGGIASWLNKGQIKTPVHAFGAIRDFTPAFGVRNRVVFPGNRPEIIRGYIGTSPKLSLLDFLNPGEKKYDQNGYTVAPDSGLVPAYHFRKFDNWGVFSFKRDVLEEVTPQLQMVEYERPAQVRMRVEDLSNRKLTPLITAAGFQQSRKASASGSHFMNSLSRQLRLDPAKCKDFAESLVYGTLQCSLGGTYKLVQTDGGYPVWISDALTPENRFFFTEVPPDYTLPILTWFRGLSGEFALTGDTLSVYAELDIQNNPNGKNKSGFTLPSFNFGEKKDNSPKKPTPPSSDSSPAEPKPPVGPTPAKPMKAAKPEPEELPVPVPN